ncbi:DUF1850 domain-containing protein [Nesterenkonia aurantiaca]|uniref:DUF1850 domain-containing protein n=1 Tax=Nesterenkonia aurantiaca TaxID=1436010 RepID=A0A4V6Q173_9MICC|nr:DUF1850 domain-containing protein [Nesterenkonia aurantiaca]TDS87321.1 hypothetical protein EV640_101103 [Nesterenkonia aurantiaca]
MSSWTDRDQERLSGSTPLDRMSRRRLLTRTGTVAAAASLSLATAMLTSCAATRKLVLQHQRSGEVYAELDISEDSEITHSWIHSIELSRWTDVYRLSGNSLVLVATRFSEYGAGMPMDEGDLRIEDGQIIIENIDREFDAIRWIHSHRVDYRIGIDGQEDLVDPTELPHRQPIELRPR